MIDPVYRYKDLEKYGYGSRTTIWRKVKAGTFLAPDMILAAPVGLARNCRNISIAKPLRRSPKCKTPQLSGALCGIKIKMSWRTFLSYQRNRTSVLRRRLKRLSTVNDLSDAYLATRKSRGNYCVPLSEDFIL